MRVKRINSDKEILVNTKKYLIKWDKSGASSLEIRFRDLIRKYWQNSIVLCQFRVPGSKLRIDFLNINKKLAVEINGPQHENYNRFFHNNSRNVFGRSIKRDLDKEKWCEDNNIKLLTLVEEDLDNFSRQYILDKFDIDIL